MKNKKSSVVMVVVVYFLLISILAIALNSCSIIGKTYYSCPNNVSKKGKLFQKLPQPPTTFKGGKFRN